MYSCDINDKSNRFFYNVGVFVGSDCKDAEPLEKIYDIFASFGKLTESEAYYIFTSNDGDYDKIEKLIELFKKVSK